MRFIFIIIWIFLIPLSINAQDKVFLGGLFPEMAITHSFDDKYSMTFKIESQHRTYDNQLDEGSRHEYDHYRTDFQLFGAIKLNQFWKFSLGYQYRLDGEDEDHNRLIQQIAYVQKTSMATLGHRLRLDQTFIDKETDNAFRIRYRFSAQFPLTGQTLNPGEYYLLASNEVLIETQGGDQEIENRLVLSLGHYFGKKAKLEGGLDWRTDKFIADGFRQRLWLKVGCFLKI